MISVTKLLHNTAHSGDRIRYSGRDDRFPAVLVMNITRNCNLRCAHCYSSSGGGRFTDMSFEVWKKAIETAADMGVSNVLVSGGEPLVRKDAVELIRLMNDAGMKIGLSTNGTAITEQMARRLAGLVDYAGISIDGPRTVHDEFRGVDGAYEASLKGIANAMEAGIKVGLRFSITRLNAPYIGNIFELAKSLGIGRICFYHLAYAGRGGAEMDIDNRTRLEVTEKIFRLTEEDSDILTADNAVDGLHIYAMTGEKRVLDLLRKNGGNRSGERIADISPNGTVYPDQFTHAPIGRIEELRRIWEEPDALVSKLRDRKKLLECRDCRYLDACNGNLRGRALALTGNLWGKDPSCYLREIGEKYPDMLPGMQ